jgi:hypothetical protein
LGVFRDRFPDFRKFRNSNQGHFAFRNFGISGIPTLKTPVFRNRSAAEVPQGISEIQDFGDFGISGTLLHKLTKFPENFGKTGNSEHFFALFFSVLRVSVYSVAKSEKPQNKMTLWNLLLFPNFPRVFSGFSGLST